MTGLGKAPVIADASAGHSVQGLGTCGDPRPLAPPNAPSAHRQRPIDAPTECARRLRSIVPREYRSPGSGQWIASCVPESQRRGHFPLPTPRASQTTSPTPNAIQRGHRRMCRGKQLRFLCGRLEQGRFILCNSAKAACRGKRYKWPCNRRDEVTALLVPVNKFCPRCKKAGQTTPGTVLRPTCPRDW
ncbi:hypothetical protein POSPLADRAFT_1050860 [Postia placenta MAD-698-R-SB12]|uniref:Uncharacterized protein n=1 Tax=Postia placenta MAD-698-R-SB12 TaxID=670580 RepID=A0A1X6MJ57_9APHY|nr:hypothetical protein POSPLADRAFT_1050860 [Postia placenta MAD-698-R-SB12]OSX56378.1 hypothetical protein POSPLADRAFT_1050860 [Postia placenta MAD-698-R-SB12]